MAAHYDDNKDDLLQRLKRIEGQVRGVQKMIDDDRGCVDILTQLTAIRAALGSVSVSVAESHTRGCIAAAVSEDGGVQKIEELMEVLTKYVKGLPLPAVDE